MNVVAMDARYILTNKLLSWYWDTYIIGYLQVSRTSSNASVKQIEEKYVKH